MRTGQTVVCGGRQKQSQPRDSKWCPGEIDRGIACGSVICDRLSTSCSRETSRARGVLLPVGRRGLVERAANRRGQRQGQVGVAGLGSATDASSESARKAVRIAVAEPFLNFGLLWTSFSVRQD
ncbi:hypothetical protein NL676_011703 [Syzygium grande]|nr:hypothetical protein NL676_011703 [Syzygium grande]